jgi:hypothetical protein
VKPKIKWAGAPIRKRRASEKVKSTGGRPRRQRQSEDYIKTVVRPWIPSALLGITGGHHVFGSPMTIKETKEHFLSVLRGMTDELTIAEEAYKFLAARDGRRVRRDDRIETIGNWLKMDAGRLKNWLNRAKRAR